MILLTQPLICRHLKCPGKLDLTFSAVELNHQRLGILIGKLAKQTTRLDMYNSSERTMCNTNYQYFKSAPRKTGTLAECQGGRGCGCTRPCIGLCRGFLEATGLQCLPPETRWPLVSFVICFNWLLYKFKTTWKAKWKLGWSYYLNIQIFVRLNVQPNLLKVCEEFDKSKGVSNQNSINELLKQG